MGPVGCTETSVTGANVRCVTSLNSKDLARFTFHIYWRSMENKLNLARWCECNVFLKYEVEQAGKWV